MIRHSDEEKNSKTQLHNFRFFSAVIVDRRVFWKVGDGFYPWCLRRIAWPAIELPKELQQYKSKVGQPFFLNHVTGRQRCTFPCDLILDVFISFLDNGC